MTRAKRPHGSGNVEWRHGAWRIRVYANRQRTSRTVHAPNTAAGRRQAERLAASLYDQAYVRRAAAGTLGALIEDWLAFRAPEWPPGAVRNARYRLDKHVPADLMARRLAEVDSEALDALYREMRRTVTPATVRRVHTLLHAALEQAVKWGRLGSNPADRATPPKMRRPKPRPVPDPERVRAAIAAADPWLSVLLRLAVHTGARRGELCALRWSDVDLEVGVVGVDQTKTDTPKVLALGPATVSALRQWREAVAVQHEAVRGPMPGDWWVFPSVRRWGEPIRPSSVTHAWLRLRSQVGLDGVRLHDLRGTMSTTLLTGGHDVRTVQGRGGWANPQVLLTRYAQFVTEADRRAAQAMDDWLDG